LEDISRGKSNGVELEDEEDVDELLRKICDEEDLDFETLRGSYDYAWEIALKVIKRALNVVRRYSETWMFDLDDKGLKVDMVSRLHDTKDGCRLVIEFRPLKRHLAEVVKSRAIKRRVKYYEEEMRKARREGRLIVGKGGAAGSK